LHKAFYQPLTPKAEMVAEASVIDFTLACTKADTIYYMRKFALQSSLFMN